MKTNRIYFYDTTLRDGSQSAGISFSLEDKVHIIEELDKIKMDYIEVGWPGSNPKDEKMFELLKNKNIKHSKIAAFGMTRHPKNRVDKDPNIIKLIKSEAPVVTLFGKSWDLHVKHALRISLQKNLKLISDSIKYIKSFDREVIFDAEHFFDGYKNNPDYAVKTLVSAIESGADWLSLCDTNGGLLPHEMIEILNSIKNELTIKWGVHCHNDSETAVANSLLAIELGATQIQGTINGYGERCGNANLISIIPSVQLKMNKKGFPKNNLKRLTYISRYFAELANTKPNTQSAYVGENAFAHKGGIHVSAVNKLSSTYEHINPELVGNERKILISELSGKSNILNKAKQYNIDDSSIVKNVVDKIKSMEEQGYHFESAEASVELLIKRITGKLKEYFKLEGFRVIIEKDAMGLMKSEATIKVNVNNDFEHTAAEGNGPVEALDKALRKVLVPFYPELNDIKLSDFKVRVLDEKSGTASKVRVIITLYDQYKSWSTVGVSENIIEASYIALTDGVLYKLLKKNK